MLVHEVLQYLGITSQQLWIKVAIVNPEIPLNITAWEFVFKWTW